MQDFIDFLIQVGKLKKMKRKGWVYRGVKNPETIAEHSFRMTLLAWLLGKKKGLDTKKLLKIALIHDLCEVYAGDITPYDKILPKDKKKREKVLRKWPRFLKPEEIERLLEKHKKEWQSLITLTSRLSPEIREEIINLWLDYEEGLTKEGRFVRQVDKVENLLQALEYWEKDKKFPIKPWWIEIKETIDDPLLIEFIDALDRKFHQKKKSK